MQHDPLDWCDWWYLSGKRKGITVAVACFPDSDIIELGPPIVRKFIGQPLSNLERWLATKAERMDVP